MKSLIKSLRGTKTYDKPLRKPHPESNRMLEFQEAVETIREPKKKLVIMIGIPASGKSHIAKEEYPKLKIVSRDMFNKSKAKERKKLKELLDGGEEVVIDDTNYNRKTRKELIDLAKEYKYDPVGIYVYSPLKLCLKRNKNREDKIPTAGVKNIAKRFEVPSIKEGFVKLRMIVNTRVF